MTTQTLPKPAESKNPFRAQGSYSESGVELMRALSVRRKQTGKRHSSPTELLEVLEQLGYRQPVRTPLPKELEIRRFTRALSAHQSQENAAYTTCDDVLSVLDAIGYYRLIEDTSTVLDGMPIDRRRKEEDERIRRAERRSHLDPSPQELLELTDEEHRFLDALKTLRINTGRAFAASEELLSIVWELGYRPTGTDGVPVSVLSEAQRCEIQAQFTNAVERSVATTKDCKFLTCRSVFEIVAEIGFRKVDSED